MSFTTNALPGFAVGSAFPALSTKIVELATPSFALRPLFQTVPFPAGKQFVFYKEKGARAVGVSRAEEGAVTVIDYRDYEVVTYEPPTYKQGVWISKGLIDTLEPVLPVVENQLRTLARRVAVQIESDIELALRNNAGATVTATGTSLGFTGTEFTIDGTIGTKDILAAQREIMKNDLVPEYLAVHPVQYNQLRYLPHYSAYSYAGEPYVRTGPAGEIEGLKVLVSTVIPAGTAYVLSTGTNPSGAYEPLGYWVEKSPFTAYYSFDTDTHFHKVSTYYHAGPLVVSSANIVKITV